MFALLKKKNVVTDVKLEASDEISLLKVVAQKAASKLGLDGQEIKSGLFASAAAGTNQIVANRVLLTHASTESIKDVQFVILTLSDAIYWNGDVNQPVDYVVVTVMPAATDTPYEDVAQKISSVITANAGQLSDWHENAGQLNQLLGQFK
jgi:mannitol/fructose-specific phosphotransferase system IIA component (Ntr-type)